MRPARARHESSGQVRRRPSRQVPARPGKISATLLRDEVERCRGGDAMRHRLGRWVGWGDGSAERADIAIVRRNALAFAVPRALVAERNCDAGNDDRSGRRLRMGHEAPAHPAPDQRDGKERHEGNVEAASEMSTAHASTPVHRRGQVKRAALRRNGTPASERRPKQGARRMAGLLDGSIVAVDAFASLVPLLRFERQGGDRPRVQPLE
jgi:hypothetical protein